MNKNFCIILLLLLVSPTLSFAKDPERIFYTNGSKQTQVLTSIKKNYKKIDILAPQSYVVTADLKLSGGLGAELKKTIKTYHVKIMPLVANNRFSQSTIHNLLINDVAQAQFISNLVAIAKQEKYIGWQFDFENINYKDKDLYTAFVQRTYNIFKNQNILLSIAVIPITKNHQNIGDKVFENWSGAFDYKKISESSDFVSVMTYDDPDSVGPVASLPFIKDCLDNLKDKIPAEKLSLGIPLYYWSWDVASSKKINIGGNYDRLLKVMANSVHWSDFEASLGNAWMYYFDKGQKIAFWYTDKKTMQLRMELIQKNNLRGFSAWLLGVEDPSIWQAI